MHQASFNQDSSKTNPSPDLGWGLRVGWGVGSLGSTTLINGVSFVGLFYFSSILGISPALAGSLLFIAKLYDIFTDPLMGYISDRSNTRWGRRRPFLLVAALLSGAAFLMLFNVPTLSGGALTGYLLASLLLYATGYTLFNIPYLAMPAEMTSSYHERSRLMSARVVFAALGILAGGSLATALISYWGGDREAYRNMSWVLAAIISGSMLAAFFGTSRAVHTQHITSTLSWRAQLKLMATNQPYIILMGAKLLHMFGVALANSALLFLVTGVLQRDTAAVAFLVLISTGGTLASVPIWLSIAQRLGKRNCYWLAMAILLPFTLSWLVATPSESVFFFGLRGLGIGVATAGLTLAAQAMLPDTIDHDAKRCGLRREGVFTAGYSFMEKTAFALGPLILGILLEAYSYSTEDRSVSNSQANHAILLGAAVLPAAASLLSAAVLWFYQLDSSYLHGGTNES